MEIHLLTNVNMVGLLTTDLTSKERRSATKVPQTETEPWMALFRTNSLFFRGVAKPTDFGPGSTQINEFIKGN